MSLKLPIKVPAINVSSFYKCIRQMLLVLSRSWSGKYAYSHLLSSWQDVCFPESLYPHDACTLQIEDPHIFNISLVPGVPDAN